MAEVFIMSFREKDLPVYLKREFARERDCASDCEVVLVGTTAGENGSCNRINIRNLGFEVAVLQVFRGEVAFHPG